MENKVTWLTDRLSVVVIDAINLPFPQGCAGLYEVQTSILIGQTEKLLRSILEVDNIAIFVVFELPLPVKLALLWPCERYFNHDS